MVFCACGKRKLRSQQRMPSRVPEGLERGWIVPIGGAENKENDRGILERFVRCSGGAAADLVVIPTASRVHETGERYEQLFRELGAARVTVMDFDTRRDCQEQGRLERIGQASGIFFTGGNQLRVTTLLGGTPVAKLIRLRNARGVTVGGTSAGASILSEHMIAAGDEGSSMIEGSGAGPIVDGADVTSSSIDSVEEGQPVGRLGLRLHLLVAGATFNLHTRVATAATLLQAKE